MNVMLDKAECAMLKAVAIVLIMAHNFCHLLSGIGVVPENEYSFRVERVRQLCDCLLHPDVSLLHHLLSFFGHYGVPVFLFLSGYGLVMKYEREKNSMPGASRFIGRHYVKLLKLMALGLVAYYVILFFQQDHFVLGKKNVLTQLLMCVNLLPQPWYHIKPGPYWFFGLMMQLYIIYRLLLYAPRQGTWRRWVWPVLFIMLCWVAQVWGSRHGMLYWMRYNFFVAALPLSMGLLAGRYCPPIVLKRWQWLALMAMAAVAVFLMNFKFHLWLWSPVMVVIAAIALVKALPARCHGVLVWTGGVSAMLFVVHPLVRAIVMQYASADVVADYGLLLLYLLVSVVLAVGYRWLLDRIRI